MQHAAEPPDVIRLPASGRHGRPGKDTLGEPMHRAANPGPMPDAPRPPDPEPAFPTLPQPSYRDFVRRTKRRDARQLSFF